VAILGNSDIVVSGLSLDSELGGKLGRQLCAWKNGIAVGHGSFLGLEE
jgi:hypothetical protein